ncbi:MAG: hypothetical protein WDZ76_00245 [Pseudohongiellaceae bacterium]
MSEDNRNSDDSKQSRRFFGMEVSNTVTYVIVVILALIFVRQAVVLFRLF